MINTKTISSVILILFLLITSNTLGDTTRNSFGHFNSSLSKPNKKRPTLPLTTTSQSGRFKFHYTLTGYDAIDSTCTNDLNIPDWIYEAELAAEKGYHILVDSLKFAPPPTDGDEYDIYFLNLGRQYGQTFPEDPVTMTDRSHDFTSYMVIENDFKGNFQTHGIQALQVTIVHEYFHAVQLGYAFNTNNYLPKMYYGDAFFLEWSSTWFEDYCYPEVNDYIAYINNFVSYMDNPIWTYSGNWHYGVSGFLKFLVDNYSTRIITKTWDKIKDGERAFFALKETIEKVSDRSFPDTYNEYCARLFYSGANYDLHHSVSSDAGLIKKVYVDWGDRYEYNNFLTIQSSLPVFSTRPIEITFLTKDHYGLEENRQFDDRFIGRFVLNNNHSPIINTIDLDSDQYIEKSNLQDTLILFLTNQNIEESSELNLHIKYIKPEHQFFVHKLFPNPIDAGNALTVHVATEETTEKIEMIIYNLTGQKIHQKIFQKKQDNLYSLSLQNHINYPLASGIYLLKVRADGKEELKKFTIIK